MLALTAALVLAAASFAPAAAPPPEPIAPFEARYEVHRGGKLAGEARMALIALGDERREWTTRTRGTRGVAALAGLEVDERTVFRWREGLPELVESWYDQRAAWTSRKRSLRVDAASGTIAAFDGKRLHTLEHAAGTIDVHATPLALGSLLAGGARDAALRVATRDEIESHRWERVGTERVETPLGPFEAIRMRRVRDDDSRVSETWFAPALGHLVVRARHDDRDGERIELRLVAYDGPRLTSPGGPASGTSNRR